MKHAGRRALAGATGLAVSLSLAGAVVVPAHAQSGPDRRPSARYAAIVREDPTAAIDSDGHLYYTEPLPDRPPAARPTGRRATPEFPLDQTFALHSTPGSQRTIYIDFNGQSVAGTAWNDEGLPAGTHPAWSLDANAATFSDHERTVIQEIWERVAEDYAPFDVDVTTQDPGDAALLRSSSSDQVYGTRALVTPSTSAVTQTCDNQCVGIAYMDVFDEVGGHHQPVWVFPQSYDEYIDDGGAKGIAETIAHEVGHNLNLEHDGDSQSDYAEGHPPWAPIMGNSDSEPISQWSKGDYPGANNHQDDLAVIAAAGVNRRADEAGDSIATAAPTVPSGTAYITTRADKDFYDLGACSGAVTVAATGVDQGADLDIQLTLFSLAGAQVATANPASAKVSAMVASGMNATVSTSVPAGTYVVSVDGIGNGNWTTGYDDYASLGAYTLAVTGCGGGGGGGGQATPAAPGGLSAASGPDGTTAAIAWTPPLDTGDSAISGYQVTVGGVTDTVGAGTLTFTATGLAPGQTYDVSVAAVNGAGTGDPATGSVTTYGVPVAPMIMGATSGRPGGKVTGSVRWMAPDSDGGTPVTGYRIKATRWSSSGRALSSGTTNVLAASQLSSVLLLRPAGIWSFQVQARNGIGWSAFSSPSAKIRGR